MPALAHRLILSPELWAREVRPEKAVEEVLGRVPVPKVGQVEGRRKALWELVLLALLLGAGLFLRRRELLLLSIPLTVQLVGRTGLGPTPVAPPPPSQSQPVRHQAGGRGGAGGDPDGGEPGAAAGPYGRGKSPVRGSWRCSHGGSDC